MDTEAAGKDYVFLKNPEAQSPEYSDAENSRRMCIDEPMYQSAEVSKICRKNRDVLTSYIGYCA
jgi:hypothetical protein